MKQLTPISVRFTPAQKEAIAVLAKRDRRAAADTVRELVTQALRQRGADIREILDRGERVA
jgi:hypothetical protein